MFRFIPSPDYRAPHIRVRDRLCDTIKALEIADEKLGESFAEFDEDDNEHLSRTHLLEFHATVRVTIAMLTAMVGKAMPTLDDHVFETIRNHPTMNAENPTYWESANLALSQAILSIDEAMLLSQELDDDEVDEACMFLNAARFGISTAASFIDCAISHGGKDEMLRDLNGLNRKAAA